VRFPALRIAREAMIAGTAATAALNAADEIAVRAFLDRGIGFLGIAATVERVLERMAASGDLVEPGCVDDVLRIDGIARAVAREAILAQAG
jgi:1-deoxy-D-xylulose-5-phosphate reductoisomerase